MYEVQTKPKIYIDFDSPDGNIFTILAHVENAMKVYSIINAKEKAAEMRERVTKSESYEDALEIITGFICNWDFEPKMVFSLILIYMVFSLLYTYLYFLPYLIANKKSHPQTRAIYILNIFAGWTFIGWLIALIWGCTEPSEKKVIRETVQVSGADELIKYKSLLDTGVITQEEFDNKKDQLLHGN